ncbi:twin-arginine translocation signal domain-containing protein [Breoghania sp.]|uniref:twin-arginine translocation signal domain-containing protein n=1 Tax=Breoghania sp. TaxID=2065378 RepID=UPI002AAA6E64|nr:twin-arginine translocation signal domain-containing protein [Breoghania sp.]
MSVDGSKKLDANEIDDNAARTDRRGFLKLASLGTLAGGAAVITGADAGAAEAVEEGRPGGYRVTEHVKRAYETARF